MCLSNAPSPCVTLRDWYELFPSGVPSILTAGEPWIDPLLLKGKKGAAKKSALEEILKNAQAALRDDWFQKIPNFPWLAAQRSDNLNQMKKEN